MCVEGRLKSRPYPTQSGETRRSNAINVTDVQFLGQRIEQGAQGPENNEEAAVDLPL